MGKGAKNVYTCGAGHHTVTIDQEDGVTPFMILCEHEECIEMAKSHFYNVNKDEEPTHEWYKPTELELQDIDRHSEEHVLQGGLLIRGIDGRRCKNAEYLCDYVVGLVYQREEVEVKLHPVTAKSAADAIRTALIETCPKGSEDATRSFVQSNLIGMSVEDMKTELKRDHKVMIEIIKI